MSLGERLRSLRRSHKFSAGLLADACGVKAGAYRRWERDETEPSITQAVELARIYQKSLDAMLFGDDSNASTVALDVEPGEQITVRIMGSTGKPKIKYEPAVVLGNVLSEKIIRKTESGM